MDNSTFQGLTFISMASNNSPVLPRALISSVSSASIWEGSMVQENECNPQQILNSSEDQQVNHSESTDDRYEKMENNFVKTTIFFETTAVVFEAKKNINAFFSNSIIKSIRVLVLVGKNWWHSHVLRRSSVWNCRHISL